MVRRIAAPPRPAVELQFFSVLSCPCAPPPACSSASWCARSRARATWRSSSCRGTRPCTWPRTACTSWRRAAGARTGLRLVADAKDAAATFTYQAPALDLTGDGPRHRRARPPRPSSSCPWPRRAAPRARRSYSERGHQGGEDLRPEPRLHGEELRRRRRRSASCSPPRAGAARASRRWTSCAPRPTCSRNDALRKTLTEPRVHLRQLRQGRGAQGAGAGRARARRAATASS